MKTRAESTRVPLYLSLLRWRSVHIVGAVQCEVYVASRHSVDFETPLLIGRIEAPAASKPIPEILQDCLPKTSRRANSNVLVSLRHLQTPPPLFCGIGQPC